MARAHRELLEAAVASAGPALAPLRDAAVYVTGASGFLAASLLAFLKVADERHGLGLRLAGSARRTAAQVPLFRYLDVAAPATWEVAPAEAAVLPAADGLIVVHAASYGSPRDYLREPLATYEANTTALLRLYRQAAARGARHFVYVSTAEVYGQPPESAMPTPEDYIGGLDTLAVRSVYGESKRMAEVLGACLAAETSVPFTALRPWNLYGPGQRRDDGRVPVEFLRQAAEEGAIILASDGTPRRCPCFVWDGIRQIAATLGASSASPVAWNIGNPAEEITMLDLARRCAATAGLPADAVRWNPAAKAGGMSRSVPDVCRVQALAGDVPFRPLADGLAATLDWLRFLARHA
ncbi:MAG: NAD-dependent epimerase/dehydratase family protein [Limisphaerales bacterium]